MVIKRSDLDAGLVDLSQVIDPDQPPLGPVHPGDIIREDVLKPWGMSAYRFAKEIGVPANRMTEIVAGRRAITADTALRLAKRLGTSALFWMNLQVAYDLEVAKTAQEKRQAAQN